MVGPFEVESNSYETSRRWWKLPVIGKTLSHSIGELVKAFCCPEKEGFEPTDEMQQELICFARKTMGPAVAPKRFSLSKVFPKPKVEKFLRNCSKLVELGLPRKEICPHLKKGLKIMEKGRKIDSKRQGPAGFLQNRWFTHLEGLTEKSREEYLPSSLKSVDFLHLYRREGSSCGVNSSFGTGEI